VNRDNVQGDILGGLVKMKELFYFFQISNAATFRQQLVKYVPHITNVTKAQEQRNEIKDRKKKGEHGLCEILGVNIAFSHKGFDKMGIDDSSLTTEGRADSFLVGQKQEAVNILGDPSKSDGTPDWDDKFLQDIHGVIIVTGDSDETIRKEMVEVDRIFHSSSIKEIISVYGKRRPDKLRDHEHFGFLDGISEPAVKGFDEEPKPGHPAAVNPGVIVTGYFGDPAFAPNSPGRDPWAFDGSFLAFRWLFQLVPEFDKYLNDHPVKKDGKGNVLSQEDGSKLLGARMVGRWKSGASLVKTPWKDDEIADNDFNFAAVEGEDLQFRCPFAAHIRKTNPRNEFVTNLDANRIIRRGIQFGPEVKDSNEKLIRGLLFASYQTSFSRGFKFHQESWANNGSFRPGHGDLPGLDPIIGQGTRIMSGLDPLKPNEKSEVIEDFVIPRGGEYFFSPSLSSLEKHIGEA